MKLQWQVNAEKLNKKKTLIAAEHDRPDIARRRAQWTKYRGRIDPIRLVFIYEPRNLCVCRRFIKLEKH